MNSKLATISLVLLVSSACYSQGQGRRNMDPEQMAQRNNTFMKDSLDLTDAQLKKVEKVNLEAANKMNETFENNSEDREAMRASMAKITEETNRKFKEILTASQYEKYMKLTEARRNRMRQRGGGGN